MDDIYYPVLEPKTIKALTVIRQLARDHASYWLTSPYSGEVQSILSDLFKAKAAPADVLPNLDDDEREEWEFLASESKTLYVGLKNAGIGLEGNELMSYYKTSAGLLEKLLSFQERANNLKQISDFYQVVLSVMEEVLNADQRTAVMDKLKEAMKA